MDYLVGKSRVVCNPLGYPLRSADGHWFRENARFDPNLVVEVNVPVPTHQILQDAAAQRNALAAQWFSAAQVDAMLSSLPGSGEDLASQLRREGQILAVYVTHPVSSYRYPTWQFHPEAQIFDHLAEILSVLRDFGPFPRAPEGLRRTTGWGEVEWFLSPHALLDGATPAAILTVDPARVLRAARVEFKSANAADH